MNSGATPSYKPSAYFWRKDIREAKNLEELQVIAMRLVVDLEAQKAFIRALGAVPPKVEMSPSEVAAKPALLERFPED